MLHVSSQHMTTYALVYRQLHTVNWQSLVHICNTQRYIVLIPNNLIIKLMQHGLGYAAKKLG